VTRDECFLAVFFGAGFRAIGWLTTGAGDTGGTVVWLETAGVDEVVTGDPVGLLFSFEHPTVSSEAASRPAIKNLDLFAP
jgi:hypothetical protein